MIQFSLNEWEAQDHITFRQRTTTIFHRIKLNRALSLYSQANLKNRLRLEIKRDNGSHLHLRLKLRLRSKTKFQSLQKRMKLNLNKPHRNPSLNQSKTHRQQQQRRHLCLRAVAPILLPNEQIKLKTIRHRLKW